MIEHLDPNRSSRRFRRLFPIPRTGLWLLLALGLLGVLLGGCVADPNANPLFAVPSDASLSGQPAASQGQEGGALEESAVVIPTPTPLPEVTVTVRNRSVNIRSGPGTNFPVIAGAKRGASFQAIGRNGDSSWWQICCVRGPEDGEDEATQTAWISNIVVNVEGPGDELPVVGELFPGDLTATWSVDYECDSQRCVVPACEGAIEATVRNAEDKRWLEIERQVSWQGDCGEPATWVHQIDRFTGEERYSNDGELFFFNYWVGEEPGEANSLYTLPDGRQILAWCSDSQSAEVEEANGWTAVYEGKTCYDQRTGMLVSMDYTKRWLFTGTFEGEEYDRAYFGDMERYTIRLEETNVKLAETGE